MKISADTIKMIEAACELEQRADLIEKQGRQLEQLLRAQRAGNKRLWFFDRSTRNIDALAAMRAEMVEGLRNQSLFLRECAKRYKNAQSLAALRADYIK